MDQIVIEGLQQLCLTKDEEADIPITMMNNPDLLEEYVGKDIFQFKFSLEYQMEWVERNGPWNFDNNLLLLCRWRKGLSIWGLPFENLSEEVGRDLANSLGRYIDTNKRSWLFEQARFMRVIVDLPLDKPLRRGGNIVNLEGEKTWVTFRYERLPTFCFQCGWFGHDEKHCQRQPHTPNSAK
ncbi:hypothetical protein SO802_005591 [Lithocarpus litseifolius]|uniref:Zinc knuckle CX2CX4HX4C domain-containing protein n=1 Tax=Lithocarpus litseifolius TaxID=425828 RepID=A0AAW2DLC9_9ROSI